MHSLAQRRPITTIAVHIYWGIITTWPMNLTGLQNELGSDGDTPNTQFHSLCCKLQEYKPCASSQGQADGRAWWRASLLLGAAAPCLPAEGLPSWLSSAARGTGYCRETWCRVAGSICWWSWDLTIINHH